MRLYTKIAHQLHSAGNTDGVVGTSSTFGIVRTLHATRGTLWFGGDPLLLPLCRKFGPYTRFLTTLCHKFGSATRFHI